MSKKRKLAHAQQSERKRWKRFDMDSDNDEVAFVVLSDDESDDEADRITRQSIVQNAFHYSLSSLVNGTSIYDQRNDKDDGSDEDEIAYVCISEDEDDSKKQPKRPTRRARANTSKQVNHEQQQQQQLQQQQQQPKRGRGRPKKVTGIIYDPPKPIMNYVSKYQTKSQKSPHKVAKLINLDSDQDSSPKEKRKRSKTRDSTVRKSRRTKKRIRYEEKATSSSEEDEFGFPTEHSETISDEERTPTEKKHNGVISDEQHAKVENRLRSLLPFTVEGDKNFYTAFHCLRSCGNAFIFEAHRKSDKHRKSIYILKLDVWLKPEIEALSVLNHPNIIEMLDHGHANLLGKKFEFIILHKYTPVTYTLLTNKGLAEGKKLREIGRSLLQAISYCHSRNFLVRDIKVENLVKEIQSGKGILGYKLRMIDFGVAVEFSKLKSGRYCYADGTNEVIVESCGTHGYMAPEVVEEKFGYGPKSDVFSLGLTLAELACGRPFHSSANPVSEALGVLSSFKHITHKQEQFLDLVRSMLQSKPERRPSISECLEDEFFL